MSILVVLDDYTAAMVLQLGIEWPTGAVVITDLPIEAVEERYSVVVNLDGLPIGQAKSKSGIVAMICRSAEAFNELLRCDLPGDLVFVPDPVALMDLFRKVRRTLVARRPLRQGETLMAEDVEAAVGGEGVSEGHLSFVVGRRILYDLSAGAPIDFGVLD